MTKNKENLKLKTPLNQSTFQRFVGAVWCDIFSHPMRFDSSNTAGPSTCRLCGHKEPGIKWGRGPSTELFSDAMKNLDTGKIGREAIIRDSKSRRKTYEEIKP